MVSVFLPLACLIVTLHIVDLWQYYVCCTRSDLIRCTHFVVLYQRSMCRAGFTWCFGRKIAILMSLFTAEPHSTAGLLFPSQCLSRMILMTVFDGVGMMRGQAYPSLASLPFVSSSVFPFSSFVLWIGIVWLGSSN